MPRGKDRSRSEWEKLKELSFSDKLSYMWEYYSYYIIGVAVAIVVTISLATTCGRGTGIDLSIVWNATFASQDELDALSDAIRDEIFGEDSDKTVLTYLFFTLSDDPQTTLQNSSRIMAMLAAEMIDIFVFDSETFYIYRESLLPMDSIIKSIEEANPAVYERIKDELQLGEHISGIRLNDSPLLERLDFPLYDEVYLAVAMSTRNIDYVTEAIIALFE